MILSIQSHVAYGRVGNRSAVFPLELLGHDVIAVNTVQFSNHTGYGHWTGEVFPAEHIRDVINGVEARDALNCSAVLSGYMGNPDTGAVILDAADRVRRRNPNALFCLDPVMGDYNTGFYVLDGIPEFIRNEALKRATIVTPNQFEAEYLSGMTIDSLNSMKEAARRIHALGPEIVIITSIHIPETGSQLGIMLSCEQQTWLIKTDRLSFPQEPNGGGDLTSALFLGWYLQNGDAVQSLNHMTNSVYAAYERTAAAGKWEIDLVGSRFDIMTPPLRYSAEQV